MNPTNLNRRRSGSFAISRRAVIVAAESLERRLCLTAITFAPAVSSFGQSANTLAVGDFNGDGKTDLATSEFGGNGSVGVLLGKGNGTCQAPVTYAAGVEPDALAVGDFKGDGTLDLVAADLDFAGGGALSVLMGNGNGTFQPAVTFSAAGTPMAVAVGDFNGDGKLDLAVADSNSSGNEGWVAVFLGNGNGTFQLPDSYPTGAGVQSIAVGDFNGDGKLDLVVGDGRGVDVLSGNGNGTFQPAAPYAAGGQSFSVAVGDFNGDGKLDIVSADDYSNQVDVLLGNSHGTFRPAVSYALSNRPSSVAVADFNGDGKPDLAVGGGAGLDVLTSNGDGTFQAPLAFSVANGGDEYFNVGDFNGDGKPDLAVGAGNVYALLNTSPYAPSTVTGTVFDDANGDGTQDHGETGLAGVRVYADLREVGHYVAGDPTALTNATGGYIFLGLTSGSYVIRQVAPSGYAQGIPGNNYGRHVTVSAGQHLSGQNFGDYPTAPASISGTVFNDANGDAIQDHGEAGLAGVQVYADVSGVGHFVPGDPTTMTNPSGAYTLSGLAAGSYLIRQSPPAGDIQTDPANYYGRHVTLSAGQVLSGQNFGDMATATITGTVFDDANDDGIQDDGETALTGVQVYLDLGDIGYFVAGDPTTLTNLTGGYMLSGLAAGSYVIRQVRPSGYVQTTPASGYGRHITVAAGKTLSGQNFGDEA